MTRPGPAYPVALTAAAVTFLFGFVGLNLLYFFGVVDQSVRGLYSYSSATLGDGVFLPLSIAGLVCLTYRRSLRFLALEIAASLAGLASGIAVVYGWVADMKPDVNWTLPEPHVLSAPGWYHGVFLTLTAGVVCWGVARAVSGRAGPGQRQLDLVGLPLVLVGVTGFGITLIADNVGVNTAGARSTLIGLALIVGLVILLVVALLWRRRHRGKSEERHAERH